MRFLIINSAPYTLSFVDPIIIALQNNLFDYDLVTYNNIPDSMLMYNGIIISASPKGDDIINEHIPFYKWIINSQTPLLGICHGHQLIGVMYGAALNKKDQSEEGMVKIDVIKNNLLLGRKGTSHIVEHHHEYGISLPCDFELLAKSPNCEVQAMKHKHKSIYSVQYHAEHHIKTIMNFINIISRNQST
ncbi:MAG: gamma-glutamyl-gamma-aminobutyrate hydrolase family protein [Marinilabiliaceae bacterium]|nr:gamma-glutamyl-gamma-aminobutyrate hydrolase family protein [Marinilabiliaceae bacterium]